MKREKRRKKKEEMMNEQSARNKEKQIRAMEGDLNNAKKNAGRKV
ncbi:hypothetical protein [Treponema sp. R80B11-R83G3]